MGVVPFRRPKKKPAPEPPKKEPERCPDCGWAIPTSVRAERAAVRRPITFSIECPECGAELIMVVTFT